MGLLRYLILMIETNIMIVQIIMVLLAILILYVVFKLVKNIAILALNSLLALIGLVVVNMIFGLGIVVNIWSILIVALGGIPGFVLVLVLHFLGIAF